MTPSSQTHPVQQPASPWTEAYHDAPAFCDEAETPTSAAHFSEHAYADESVRPTHDALSTIYNSGYPA